VNGANSIGWTALHHGHCYPNIIDSLIRGGAEVNARTSGGITPLMMAVHDGSIECVVALINAGADINARTGKGASAIKIAAGRKDASIVQLLKYAGAESP
jgi:ankyrin repeat protein